MNELALFESALRAAVPTQPDPRVGHELVPRLAQAARAATIEAETQAGRRGTAFRGSGRAHSRRASVARVAVVVGLIPFVLAGLAAAGVTVPTPARDAFDSVGVTLPNQHSEQGDARTTTKTTSGGSGTGSGNDVSNAARTKAKGKGGNSAAAHQHAREQRAKARGKAKGHSRGKAIGLNDLTPPGQSAAQSHPTGPPAHSNAGGSARSQSSHRRAPRARPNPRPFPPANSRGHSK